MGHGGCPEWDTGTVPAVHVILDEEGQITMSVFHFDAAAYRRIRLPWLLLVLLLSLAVDGILIFIWRTGVEPNVQFYWNIGFGFFGLVNVIFGKGVALHRYLQIKKLRARSYVQLEENEVIHYLLRSRMTHWQVKWVKETSFSAGGKEEYISADTFYIRQVKNIRQKANGSIVIEGTIERESLNEGWEEYSSEFGKAFVKTLRRHEIPAYYEGMDMIFQALHRIGDDFGPLTI